MFGSMRIRKIGRAAAACGAALAVALTTAAPAAASHSWSNYHWARTSNPFTVKLGDNLSSVWKPYLQTASGDWTASSVLDAPVVAGLRGACNIAWRGTVQVCNKKYGDTGWLGIAQIAIDGDHITAGAVKVNDTYFSTAKYNKPEWRRLVMCQEVGHTFGLDHQDEVFSNTNLGTCMDYTDDPSGTIKGQLSNEHPNAHDYEELACKYDPNYLTNPDYKGGNCGAVTGHQDSISTVSSQSTTQQAGGVSLPDSVRDFGRSIRSDSKGRPNLFVRDLGAGQQVLTFVFWAD